MRRDAASARKVCWRSLAGSRGGGELARLAVLFIYLPVVVAFVPGSSTSGRSR